MLAKINTSQPIETFIDVGANIGQTLLKLKAINSEARYIGFEPNPKCTYYTSRLIKLNSLEGVEIVQSGLSNHRGTVNLEFANKDIYDSSASTVPGFRPKVYQSTAVNVLPLDELIHSLSIIQLDVIKVDIEGGELEAFEGMTNTLKQFKPLLIFESLPDYQGENSARAKRQSALSTFLKSLDYNLYQIVDKRALTLKKIRAIPSHAKVELADYVGIPSERKPQEFNLQVD